MQNDDPRLLQDACNVENDIVEKYAKRSETNVEKYAKTVGLNAEQYAIAVDTGTLQCYNPKQLSLQIKSQAENRDL